MAPVLLQAPGGTATLHDLPRPPGSEGQGPPSCLAASGSLLAVGWSKGPLSLVRIAPTGAEYELSHHELLSPQAAPGRMLRSLLSRWAGLGAWCRAGLTQGAGLAPPRQCRICPAHHP